jgi:hypothetical protein
MIHAFLFYMMTNIFVMYVMCRKKLKLLGKIVTNDGKPQEEDKDEKVVVEICRGDFKSPHKAPLIV